MITYKETIDKPRLIIRYDDGAVSPRNDDGNIGFFLTKESHYQSPDGTINPLYQIMVETSQEAKSTNEHIKLMEARAHEAFKESAPKDGSSHDESLHVIEIHPVYRYEHGNVAYKRGIVGGFDYSNCGFYIVTAEGISGSTWTEESIAKQIDSELETYTNWANGEVYRFTLYNENGEWEDSCGGFYKIEDIREYLPDEWADEDLMEYLK